MPAKSPFTTDATLARLIKLGQGIRAQRKALRINAATVAEAAGMSRVTLHRIEKGEPAVTIGAYMNVLSALNLELGLADPARQAARDDTRTDRTGWIPAQVRLADYPQLKALAWQLHGAETLTPTEALDIYERNWRHVDESALQSHERQLIDALRQGLGRHVSHV